MGTVIAIEARSAIMLITSAFIIQGRAGKANLSFGVHVRKENQGAQHSESTLKAYLGPEVGGRPWCWDSSRYLQTVIMPVAHGTDVQLS